MYESFYEFDKRPFAATADVDATVETPAVADVVARIDRCVRQGRGIGVLTAAGGFGKTHLCHQLARLWQGEFPVAMLPNAGFPSGRGLLQAILAELEQPYQGLKETELRIELTSVARAIREESAGLVLILDDAHRGSDRLLEEIRLLANLIDAGEPLVRIVLAGRIELEDRLSDPALAGMNERIGELVSLPRLTSEESQLYLEQRSARAGRTLDSLFDDDAVEMLVRVGGGVPRCLNQLADHCLLLGYVAEKRRIDASIVREALEDLKRLPLQWQDPAPEPPAGGATAFDAADDDTSEWSIEIGSLSDDDDRDTAFDGTAFADSIDPAFDGSFVDQLGSPTEDDTLDGGHNFDRTPVGDFTTECEASAGDEPRPALEPIRDRFARLDANEARRRWLEELEREETARDAGRGPTVPNVTSIGVAEQTAPTAVDSSARRPASGVANPLQLLDSLESIVSEEVARDAPAASEEIGGGATESLEVVNRPDSATAASPGDFEARTTRLPVEAGRQRRREAVRKTLFSDLRRRDRPPGEK